MLWNAQRFPQYIQILIVLLSSGQDVLQATREKSPFKSLYFFSSSSIAVRHQYSPQPFRLEYEPLECQFDFVIFIESANLICHRINPQATKLSLMKVSDGIFHIFREILLNAPIKINYKAPMGPVNCRWNAVWTRTQKLRGEAMWMYCNLQETEQQLLIPAEWSLPTPRFCATVFLPAYTSLLHSYYCHGLTTSFCHVHCKLRVQK